MPYIYILHNIHGCNSRNADQILRGVQLAREATLRLFILYFVRRQRMRSWVLRNILKFVENESRENILEGLHTVLGCIHNL
jgi:hypothetical protein